MKKILGFLLFTWGLTAQAEDVPLFDITSKELATIQTTIGCLKPKSHITELGCKIIDAFSTAETPDQKILKDSTSLDGRRWLGITVVWGGPKKGEFRQSSPYFNLLILGTRYSTNFHQKISFENGYSPTYIWSTRNQEVDLINKAIVSLERNQIDRSNPAVQFAEKNRLSFYPVKTSQGKSLLLGATTKFLRQKDKTLYLVEIGVDEEGKIKYWLSMISLDNLL